MMTITRAAFLAATIFAFCGIAPAQDAAAPAPMIIYDKALGEGWQNWSWAKSELSVELNGSARRPIRVDAGAWEALYLHHEPFDTAPFKQLTFLIQGSAPDGQVRVHGLIDGKVASEGYPVKLINTGWTLVKVPLATLGVEGKFSDGFWIQNATGAALPRFFVTEIRLE
jgi:hypothetical protein